MSDTVPTLRSQILSQPIDEHGCAWPTKDLGLRPVSWTCFCGYRECGRSKSASLISEKLPGIMEPLKARAGSIEDADSRAV